MDINEKKYWLAFSAFFAFGPVRFSLLLKYFGSAKKAWEASEKEYSKINLGEKATSKFFSFREAFKIENYIEMLKKEEIKYITLKYRDYPKLLKEISDPPYVLYIKSKLSLNELFSPPSIAIVGTRNISSYGKIMTERFSYELTQRGIIVVSGLARGVDFIAHSVCLKNRGRTIAVLGCGLDQMYPTEHIRIGKEIVESGALISEFPMGMRAFPFNFPIRNRIISGLSLGVIVTEAASKSGSLITASCAAEQGREVFAVPGQVTSIYSGGTSELLKKGAKVATSITDILEEFPQFSKKSKVSHTLQALSEDEIKILEIVKKEPTSIDSLVRISGLTANKINGIVSVLELKGVIIKEGGKVYYK